LVMRGYLLKSIVFGAGGCQEGPGPIMRWDERRYPAGICSHTRGYWHHSSKYHVIRKLLPWGVTKNTLESPL
jgi:hypothetical protein